MNVFQIALELYSFYNDRMKIARAKFLCVFLLAFVLFAACREDNSQNTNSQSADSGQTTGSNDESGNSNITKDDIEELSKIIKLPFLPEETTWREDNLSKPASNQIPAPNEKKLIAVLKFSSDDANQLIRQAEKYKPVVQTEIEAENWFPTELIAQSQLSGDESLKGNSYAADNFYQPPFNSGKITRIADTNFFVLELTSF